jgi:hypothetical protein
VVGDHGENDGVDQLSYYGFYRQADLLEGGPEVFLQDRQFTDDVGQQAVDDSDEDGDCEGEGTAIAFILCLR